MATDFIVVIPARYGSIRLPGKPLLKIGSKTLIQHVYETALKSSADNVYIATDDERIVDVVSGFNANVLLTSPDLVSGTDRIHEAAILLKLPDKQVIVNVQGDEYGLNSNNINKVADSLLENKGASMATLCQKIDSIDELENKNIVKVVTDHSGNALYFSRSIIPWQKTDSVNTLSNDDAPGYKHIGIYAYRTSFLKIFTHLNVPKIERKESLEQLRALYYGYKIYVKLVDKNNGIEINTNSDLDKARKLFEKNISG